MPAAMKLSHRLAVLSIGSVLSLSLACDNGQKEKEDEGVTTKQGQLVPGAASEAVPKEAGYKELESVPNAGAIRGTIAYTGNKQAGTLTVTKDANVCTHGGEPDGSIQVADGKLKNVVVAITDDIAEGKRWPSEKAVVDNKECLFDPRVQIGRYQGEVEAKNSDPVFHNANLARIENGQAETLANIALPLQGRSQTKNLKKAGIVGIKCDVHEWMKAWIYVSKHPYAAVTQADGSYEIADVPPGEYDALIWHEELGQVEAKVKVEPGGTATLDHAFE